MTELPLQPTLWTLLAAALAVSVVTDLKSRRILDVVTLPATALALALRWWKGGVGDWESGLVSGLVAAAAGATLFALLAVFGRGFGWGDVKLMLCVGASLGYPLVVAALVFISLVGALQAVVTLVWDGALLKTLSAWAKRAAAKAHLSKSPASDSPARHIPYGVAIALGTFWAMWWERSRG